jgi:pimeloyl-ACP methyl ester carboxylesterase
MAPPDTAAGDLPGSRWADNGAVRLHYLDARPSAPGPAVLVVPGFGEEGADHVELLDALAPRRAIAVDLRGRGPSTEADDGYRIEDHVGDIEAIAADAGFGPVHVVSYSRGTSYALGWALRHADRVVSVTIGDYPAAQIVPPTSFVTDAPNRRWRQRPVTDTMPQAAIEAMVADAVGMEFWDELAELHRPVLLIRGGTRGAMVNDAVEDRYRSAVPEIRVVRFEDSGHDLWSPDPDRFPAAVVSFLEDVENGGWKT